MGSRSLPPRTSSPSQQSVEGIEGPRVSEMDVHLPVIEDPLWDLGDLLNFTVDDNFPISFDSGYDHVDNHGLGDIGPVEVLPEMVSGSDRVRKRDPRLTCSNFLAGRVPCACPEMDAALAEEEAESGKKRAKKVRAAVTTIVCQVPGCGADISGLKGYHKRHRVCLQCANASAVVFDGDSKRYCQQCGKFHVLSDFDEGRRSCRRKLERHNNRRRRKPIDYKVAVENELQGGPVTDEVLCDDGAGKDNLYLNRQVTEKEALLESEDGRISTFCSDPDSQNVQSDSVLSLVASGEAQMGGGNHSLSPPYHDNKSAYLPVCPTGRISFKLYDWNPAEFPRRLRHQIFEWLASMPVELEGYIRPGCTIFTVFIAMPKIMWAKLLEDPVSYINDLIVSPGNMLSGRGHLLVYLNNMVFRVARNGMSVMRLKTELLAPRLHYVHPTCFEAGKPMEFVACGSNLLQPKFRFLVSFAGKYLMYDYCVSSSPGNTEGDSTCSLDHQFYKIYVPHTEPNVLGPAFIEVENESGISNFIPVLIGDKEICSEMKKIQQKFDVSLFSKGPPFAALGSGSDSDEVFALRQAAFSEFLLDVAWLLRQPASESFQQMTTSSQVQRFNCLLLFLMHFEATTILERVLHNLTELMDKLKLGSVVNGIGDRDMRLLQEYMNCASNLLLLKGQQGQSSVLQSENTVPKKHGFSQSCTQDDTQDMESGAYGKLGLCAGSSTIDRDETVSLLNREVVMNVNPIKELRRNSCRFNCSSTIMKSHRTIFLLCTVVVCFGICAVIFHPQKISEFAVSIRRCLFDKI